MNKQGNEFSLGSRTSRQENNCEPIASTWCDEIGWSVESHHSRAMNLNSHEHDSWLLCLVAWFYALSDDSWTSRSISACDTGLMFSEAQAMQMSRPNQSTLWRSSLAKPFGRWWLLHGCGNARDLCPDARWCRKVLCPLPAKIWRQISSILGEMFWDRW